MTTYALWAIGLDKIKFKAFKVGIRMDHLEASATLPQRKSAAGKAVPQHPWTG